MAWVLDHSESELASRLVLLAIANHCDADGRNAWPSQEKIAAEAHVSVRTVKRCVVALAEMGELTVGYREGAAVGRARTNYYELPLFAVALDEGTSTTRGHSGPPHEGTSGADEGTSGARRGDICADEGPLLAPQEPSSRTVHEPSLEPSLEPPSRADRLPATRSATFDDCWEHYPRKLARKQAEKAWQARVRAGIPPDDLLAATLHYAQARAGQDQSYTMHGATFYGPNDRWRDYLNGIPAEARPTNGRPSAAQARDARNREQIARMLEGAA